MIIVIDEFEGLSLRDRWIVSTRLQGLIYVRASLLEVWRGTIMQV